MVPPEVVILAIQAALQLYGASRKAYVDGARGRPLVLPLPRAPGVGWDSADAWFTSSATGIEVAERHPRVQRLLDLEALDDDQKSELIDLYLALRIDVEPFWKAGERARGQFSGEQLSSLLEIRQWADGEFGQPATALQQVAGTIVNLAVDYFANTPGAVSPKKPQGRALLAFLQAIDETDFANTPVTDVAGDLMIAVLDSVSETPALFGGGDKERLLIVNVSKTMAHSARKHLADAPTTERWEAGVWLQLATRALVKGGAETVLDNPVLFLGVEPGAESNVVTQVGETVTDLLIGEDGVTFRRLVSAEGLNTVVKSGLEAVASNPEILKLDHEGLKKILIAVAEDVSQLEGSLGPDLFPEMARLVLENSAEHMDLVWGEEFQTPDRHLLVTASRSLLQALAEPPPAGARWRPRFTRDQILDVTDAVFDEVVDNPQWLVAHAAGASDHLGIAVEAMLASMRRLDGRRISAESGVIILKAGLRAVAARLPLLDELPPGSADHGRVALTAALDAVFSELFAEGVGAEMQWRLLRSSVVAGVVEVGLAELAEAGAEQRHIDALRDATRALAAGAMPVDLESFAEDVATRLAA